MHSLRYTLRSLRQAPGFTLTVVLTLALGIGATTAVFSIVNAVLLEPLPYRDPDRLMVTRLSLPDYRDVQQNVRSFEETAVWASNLLNLRTGEEVQQVVAGVISRNLLPLLGVTPAIGRNFTAEDDRQRTVILGHGLWQTLFGGQPDVLGRSIELTGTNYTVIGVAPAGFSFPSSDFQLWTPIGLIEVDARAQSESRALRIFNCIGRLAPHVTRDQAAAELEALSATLARTYPSTNANIVLSLRSLYERTVGDVRTPLFILMVTVGLLLLIACANIANLTIARTTARRREIAIRSALGAGRRRLFGQLATESIVLAAFGGAAGVILAVWVIDVLPVVLAARVPRAYGVRLDSTVLLAAMAATLFTAALFGVVPALQARGDAEALKDGRGVGGSARGPRLRAGIVVAEVSLAVLVAIGASLLVRSFLTLTARDPGFVPDNLLSFSLPFVTLPDAPARARAAAAVLERLEALPGVEAAGAATGLPPRVPQRGTRFEVQGRELTPDLASAFFVATTRDYFRTIRTPVLKGRAIEGTDTASGPPVVVINRRMAETVFNGQDPIGQRLRLVNPEYSNDWRTIVGVVGDVRYEGLDGDIEPVIYTSFEQTPFLWLYVMVRTTGDPAALVRSLRGVLLSVDPNLNAATPRPMTQVVSGTIEAPRFSMLLVSAFAALALALAAVGIYGVIAYSVTQRTREIGLRMALGAARSDVLKMVVREGVTLSGLGIGIGIAAAWLATRLMRDQLVGITPTDPLAFSAGTLLLLLLAVAASYLPAYRAARVDPTVALRAE